MSDRNEARKVLRGGASAAALALMLCAAPLLAQTTPTSPTPPTQDGTANVPAASGDPALVPNDTANTNAADSDIVVTGFRGSLALALDTKKTEAASVDAILAEDIGKFPDLNLSESIQRIAGVSITRDGGEGKNISVRGLGPQFTRVRIDGMEAIASGGGSDAGGGTNRGRGFDFNIFASDLFNAITVRKTAEAVTEEGSLGATVDLRTARPFDHKGFTLTASGQASYNDLIDKASPRGALLISDTFLDDRVGVLFSVAYARRTAAESGYSTVRFAPNTQISPGFESVLGTQCLTATSAVITPVPEACATANAAFHPRFPRFDYYINKSERLGATAAVQFQATDHTLISIDGLYADFSSNREEQYIEANSFSLAGACTAASRLTNCGVADTDVTAASYANGALIAGTFNDVDLRVENRFDDMKTKFRQATVDIDQEIGDHLKLDLLGGYASSKYNNPIQNTITFDQYNIDNFKYDFSNRTAPTLDFGTGKILDPSAYVLSQIRLRAASTSNTYKTGQANLVWNVTEGFDLLLGGSYKAYDFATSEIRRSNGTTASQDTNLACCTLPGDTLDKFSKVVSNHGIDFLIPDYFATRDYFDLQNPTARNGAFRLGPEPLLNANNTVQERDKSGYFQVNFVRDLGPFTVRGNAGVRYVETRQSATGFALINNVVTGIRSDRTYDDWLPSTNIVIEPSSTTVIRLAAARVLARPDLQSLPPGASVSVSGANRTVTVGNPNLDPYRATTYDAAFEWYYQRGAVLSLAVFQKNIDSFVQTVTFGGRYTGNSFGLPDSLAIAACGNQYPAICNPADNNWEFSAPQNSPGGRLRGVEVNFQQPLRFLPGFLRDTGVLLNYTHVSSTIKYLNSTGGIAAVADLTGLSRDAANATLYYEDKVFSGRVSAAYRSGYLTRVPGLQTADVEGINSTLNVDASLQFTLTDHFKVTLEGVNLTDEALDLYVDSRNYLNTYHKTGREFLIGARYSF